MLKFARNVLLLLAALAAAACAVPRTAAAYFPHGSGVVCPQGGGANDNGCAASPGGTILIPNLFTGYTGTTYTARPAYNVAGGDFAVGAPALAVGGACTGSQDPATATHSGSSNSPGCGIIPKDCTIFASQVINASLTINNVDCSALTSDGIFQGFEMAAVGGHAGTTLTGTNNGKNFIERYNHWVADASLYYSGGMVNLNSDTGDITHYASTLDGLADSTFNVQGIGVGSATGTTLTIASCSSCNFGIGQSFASNTRIAQQLTGAAHGVGTYQCSQACSIAGGTTITSTYIMQGISGSTSGKFTLQYVACMHFDGRCSNSVYYPHATQGDINIKYNYIEGLIYHDTGIHGETFEGVMQDGSVATTWANNNYIGNTFYQPTNTYVAGLTAPFFISTGAVPNPIDPAYTDSRTSVAIDDNVLLSYNSPSWAIGGLGITNLEQKNNYLSTTAGTFATCDGNQPVGGVLPPMAFFVASMSGTTTMTVSLWQGGAVIAVNMHNPESGRYFLAQLTGTGGAPCPDVTCTGKEGTYQMSGTHTYASHDSRATFDAITNAPTTSGNVSLDTAANIDATVLSYQEPSSMCMSPSTPATL